MTIWVIRFYDLDNVMSEGSVQQTEFYRTIIQVNERREKILCKQKAYPESIIFDPEVDIRFIQYVHPEDLIQELNKLNNFDLLSPQENSMVIWEKFDYEKHTNEEVAHESRKY